MSALWPNQKSLISKVIERKGRNHKSLISKKGQNTRITKLFHCVGRNHKSLISKVIERKGRNTRITRKHTRITRQSTRITKLFHCVGRIQESQGRGSIQESQGRNHKPPISKVIERKVSYK
ncbi:hypothetical protein DPMN_035383 [Dreissena polymorpha]|uniref:Uncharacterized protein n=1 Tax=Dreissena polymorpha TaxID=45954 RepID=A0A9D4MAG9_DREPO|nr:hypothetical protein DPMN_035383 [Dreissena polymorpha]